ncbi:unnamed protein product, partial [Rhizoctonia solani]
RSGPSPSLANICSGDQPTRNNPPIRASDLISHLVELTRGTAKPTRTLAPTSNESNPPVTVALSPMMGTKMSSSGKPGAPSRVSLRAPVMSRANVGEASTDVDMTALDAMATPEVSMSSPTPDTSISSTGSALTSPMAVECMEGPETTAKVADDCRLANEDVEMDPDSLMDDAIRSGPIQRQDWIPTTSDQSATTKVRLIDEDIVPMETTSAGVAPEESMDTADQGEQEPTTEEPASVFAGPVGDQQQVSGLVETFADMQVRSGASDEPSGEPDPEAKRVGEDVTVTGAAIVRQEPVLEPVTRLAQILGAMQFTVVEDKTEAHPEVVSPLRLAQILGAMQFTVVEDKTEAHPEVPNRSATVPAEPVADLAQTLAGMQVSPLAVDPPSLDLPRPLVDPEEYVENPFDELIQALVATHLPAPLIVPYEPESTEIGVTDVISGATGSDFISLGLADEEEEESEDEEEQALIDAAAAAAAWISGL